MSERQQLIDAIVTIKSGLSVLKEQIEKGPARDQSKSYSALRQASGQSSSTFSELVAKQLPELYDIPQ
jgi:hypothetical protein